jgi:hypothetical protein
MRRIVASLLAGLAGACATTPRADVEEISAIAHSCEALAEEHAAQKHAAQYDPSATAERQRCAPVGGVSGSDQTCWTSVRNPTAQHLRYAIAYRKQAEEHRVASRMLRDAETNACTGIAGDDRDMSPFWHREDIVRVEPFSVWGKEKAVSSGAVITFRLVPGLTVEWLQHLVDCHLARNAALGHVVPDMPDCPLVPKGVRATVRQTGDGGLAVEISAEDPETGAEVLARALRLVQRT